MKNIDKWKPGRFDVQNGRLQVSSDPQELSVSSRLITALVADAYNKHFVQHCRGRLLDLGCGKVPFYGFYRDHVDEIVCIDWDNTLHGGLHVDVSCNLTEILPLQDDHFDTVLLSDVLEHLPTPQATMNEISRILRPAGKLILNVPFMYWLHEEPHDYHRYTEHALRRMAEQSGLRVIVLEPLGGPLAVVADVISKLAIRRAWLGARIANCVQTSALAILRRRTTRNMSSGAHLFPSEYFMVAQKC